jgi:hypothetical protein
MLYTSKEPQILLEGSLDDKEHEADKSTLSRGSKRRAAVREA